MQQYKAKGHRKVRVLDALDDRDPMGMPVQSVQRRICSSSPDASSEVLPLSRVYSHYIEVVNLAAYGADIFVGKIGRRKIVNEVYPMGGMRLLHARPVHGRRGAKERG